MRAGSFRVEQLYRHLTLDGYPIFLGYGNLMSVSGGKGINTRPMVFHSKQRARGCKNTVVNCPTNIAKLQAELRLENPRAAIGALTGLTNQAKLLSEYSQGVREIVGVTQDQFKKAAESFEKTIAPLLVWAKNPRVKSELFMFRKSETGEKFSQLVRLSLEELILILSSLFGLFARKNFLPVTHKRAQIMSIRGLALSCAPNYTRISDINSFSRLHRGHA